MKWRLEKSRNGNYWVVYAPREHKGRSIYTFDSFPAAVLTLGFGYLKLAS